MSNWIVPCNIDKYDVLQALTNLNAIDWVKNANYSVGDNAYIYVSGDAKAIRYKCKVTKIGIETPDIDDSEYGVIDHNEGATYVCFERIKQYSGDVYSLEKLREKGLRGNLQSAQRLSEDLVTYLNSYDAIEQRHYSVKEAVWISAALKSYVAYKQNQSAQPSDFFFATKEIIKTALLFSNGKVDAARVNQWFNGSNLGSSANYLCIANTSNKRYRLSYFGEFNGEKEFPDTLRDEDILLYSDSQLTIADLKTFVKEVYTPIVSKIQTGFSNFLKRIIDERPFDIPVNAYTTENAYFVLNSDFCSYIKQLPFVYHNCFEIKKAQGRNTLPTINWNGIRTNQNDDFCSSFEKGIYLVYLYSYDKTCVYLTLNQGCSAIGEELGPNNDQAIIERLKQNANDICQKINIPQGFSSCLQNLRIELGSDNPIARKYEAGTVVFRKYETSSMPDDETLAEDLRQLLLIYQKINKENKKKQNKESLPDVPDDSPAPIYKWDKNLILYGPPGTGKTYMTAYYAVAICEGISVDEAKEKYSDYSSVIAQYNSLKDEKRIEFTTFHQSYGYEEFIEGIKPKIAEDSQEENPGEVKYKIEPGVFKSFCKSAPQDKPCVFIIDEINRGNISKIFGELITLIEETKRMGMPEGAEATLPYSKEKFSVPQNVYILGTMNTADRSIALMDTALRRRFNFVEMMPDSKVISDMGITSIRVNGVHENLDVAGMLDTINKRIECLYDREHTIGHAFFTKLNEDSSIETLAAIFKKSIIPLLQEYFYEDYYKIQLVLGDNAKSDDLKFILDEPIRYTDIFNGAPDIDLPEKKYSINENAFMQIESYRGIMGA